MLGPLFVIGIVLIMNIQALSMQWGMPLISLGGIVVCYFWRWRGCILACTLLSVAFAFQLFLHPSLEILWTTTLFLSFAASFVVTTLFLDESQIVLDKLGDQAGQAKESLTQLEHQSIAQTKIESEKLYLASQVEQLKRELLENGDKLKSHEKLIAIVREELISSHAQHEKLLLELFESRKQSATFEQQVARLQDKNNCLESALKEAVHLELTNDTYVNKAQEAQVLHDAIAQEMKEQIEALLSEKQSLEKTLTNLQREFEFQSFRATNKSELSDSQSVEIAVLRDVIKRSNEDLRLEKIKGEEYKITSSEFERGLSIQVENLTRKLLASTQQIAEWQRKLNDYNSLTISHAALQAKIQEHVSKESEVRLELDNKSVLLQELQHKLNDYYSLTISNAELQTQIQEHISQESELRLELADNSLLLEQLQHKLNDYYSLTISNAELQTQIQEHISQESELRLELADNSLLLEQLQRKLNDYNSLTISHAELQTQIQKHISLESELRLELADNSLLLQELQHKLNDYNSLTISHAELQTQIQEHISQESELRLELADNSLLLEQLQRKLNDYNSLKKSNAELQTQVQEHVLKESQVCLELDNKTVLLAELQSKLNDYNSMLVSHASLKKQIQVHVSKEEEMCRELDNLSSVHAEAQAANASNLRLISDCNVLKYEISSLKQELENIHKDKEALIQECALQKDKTPLLHNNEEEELKRFREIRRLEGLYLQMRDQFHEKSRVLDGTRRELFLMQEKFLSIQKDFESKEMFGDNDSEECLYEIISGTEAELRQQVIEFDKETVRLHQLIDVLMQESLKTN